MLAKCATDCIARFATFFVKKFVFLDKRTYLCA